MTDALPQRRVVPCGVEVHKLMEQTAVVAREAELAVSTVTDTMGRISTSSRRIGDIVGVMDSIAFQTNLLALKEVGGGSQVVEQAGATIDQVVRGVRRGAALMGDISTGTREQSLLLQLVNRTLSTMDGVTQQNATLVEESLAAIVSLQEQATQQEPCHAGLLRRLGVVRLYRGTGLNPLAAGAG
ncbi:methyl-accepting chemotaxis protein [Duganella aceris]|uniref:Methyl-accepting transducer domain-containing protein n=1 Tax=Duganella aceris TaxID=2703883 RepID=A0ABX0FGF8_9BURK|nr:methyl-accepting chemotaxis protein [Duganella aceris]NGZ83665.1 hypothetical protein [Duganella aceris]